MTWLCGLLAFKFRAFRAFRGQKIKLSSGFYKNKSPRKALKARKKNEMFIRIFLHFCWNEKPDV